jgi:hypothetical protein
MPNENAEQAALNYAQAVLAGDMPTILRYLAPDALGQQLVILGRSYFRYLSYQVALHTQEGDDYVFDITYQTDEAPITLRNRFRIEGDAWKIVDLSRPDAG